MSNPLNLPVVGSWFAVQIFQFIWFNFVLPVREAESRYFFNSLIFDMMLCMAINYLVICKWPTQCWWDYVGQALFFSVIYLSLICPHINFSEQMAMYMLLRTINKFLLVTLVSAVQDFIYCRLGQGGCQLEADFD